MEQGHIRTKLIIIVRSRRNMTLYGQDRQICCLTQDVVTGKTRSLTCFCGHPLD